MKKLALGLILIAVAALTLPNILLKDRQIPVTTTEIKLYRHQTGEIETLALEEYLLGVVAAEMPANFPTEALKAQAVAARTYAAQRLLPGGVENPAHPGADLCDDPRHGQAWISTEEMMARWGKLSYYQNYFKIKRAVDGTRNKVLVYNKELITAAYHASCGGGYTENSGDVWQVELPYLKSVPCPHCSDPHPVRTVTYPLNKVAERLQADLTALPTIAEQTSTGRPKTVNIAEKQIPATVFRELLNLRSTWFEYEIHENKITFTTTGHGHGIGMCQYGAKGMAENKKTHQEILSHYYPGTELAELK
ncbi:stage II sporulation protein D [Desulfofalx alkaliphila]|uniref:stage II sporulation protein D n=1 Tax=Desulfofalx alkaliphila TaxID=105483 RepID=UPI0004E1D7EB|nr:stage II sporulation protein D [Desulfofalx alkaliphila]